MVKSARVLSSVLLSAALMLCAIEPATAKPLTPADRAKLQATMFKEINRRLVDGAYLHFDTAAEKVNPLYPSKTHPMVLSMGEHFVLCTDFKTKTGQSVNIDFYVARKKNSFVIFKTAVGERKVVEKLMQAGRVKMIN